MMMGGASLRSCFWSGLVWPAHRSGLGERKPSSVMVTLLFPACHGDDHSCYTGDVVTMCPAALDELPLSPQKRTV